MRRANVGWMLLAVALAGAAPGRASAQTPVWDASPVAPPSEAVPSPDWDGLRLLLYFDVGGGGTTQVEVDPSSASYPGGSVHNDPTVGGGLRLEHTLGDFLALGVQAELTSHKLEGGDRDIGGHFDLWVKTRYLHQIQPNLAQETYLGMPVGFSMLRFDDNAALERKSDSLGWNIGLLVGTQFLVRGRLGTMLEMGWRRIELHNEVAATGANVTSKSNQFVLNVGYLMHF